MRKVLQFVTVISFIVLLFGCGSTAISEKPMAFDSSVASMSYISSGFVEAEIALTDSDSPDTYNTIYLSRTWTYDKPQTTTSFEGELDYINIYMDKLKIFMDDGFDSIQVENTNESDKDEYDYMFSYSVESESFIVYYNIDEDTLNVSGILISDGYEYDLEVTDNTETEDNETKQDLYLTATSGENSIEIHYRTIHEDNESKQKLSITKDINDVESELEIEIKEEADTTFKVSIDDGVNSYGFKLNYTDEGIHYKLDYDIDGVKGFVLIRETTDENGEIVYTYQIHENGKVVDVEKEKPEKPEKPNKDTEDE